MHYDISDGALAYFMLLFNQNYGDVLGHTFGGCRGLNVSICAPGHLDISTNKVACSVSSRVVCISC